MSRKIRAMKNWPFRRVAARRSFTVLIIVFAFKFKVLLSSSFEYEFLKLKDRHWLNLLTVNLIESDLNENSICSCGISMITVALLKKCAFCISNVLLNNYCKAEKDSLAIKIFCVF